MWKGVAKAVKWVATSVAMSAAMLVAMSVGLSGEMKAASWVD